MTHGNQITQATTRSKRGHCVPHISRFLVAVLYHEGRRRGLPMTKLVDQLLSDSLRDTPGWLQTQQAERVHSQTNLNP